VVDRAARKNPAEAILSAAAGVPGRPQTVGHIDVMR
jgi:hypothetical protein